jgi:hypothetical protein
VTATESGLFIWISPSAAKAKEVPNMSAATAENLNSFMV